MPATIQTMQHSTALSQSQTDKNKINNETQDSEPGQQKKTTKEKGEEKEEEEEQVFLPIYNIRRFTDGSRVLLALYPQRRLGYS